MSFGPSPSATGLSEHPAFIDSLIDFERLPQIKENIELNAFRLRDRQVVDFAKEEITPDHLRAALSFPFIYPPYKIGDEYYYEGAAFQCINPSRVPANEIDDFVVLQPMTASQILRTAQSLGCLFPVRHDADRQRSRSTSSWTATSTRTARSSAIASRLSEAVARSSRNPAT